jgi:ABC-type spermidine/putrescine transport system permease subunit I
MTFMLQAGGGILDRDGNLIFGTTAKDANIRALRFLTDFTTKHKVTPGGVASYNFDEAHTLFVQGRAAFGMGTGGVIGRLMKENPALFEKVGVLDVLQGPAAKLTAGFYNPMFVWKHGPNKEAAKTFIRWFVQPGRLDSVYRAVPGQHWPIFKTEIGSERVQSNHLLKQALERVVPHTVDFAYPGFGRPEMGVIDGEKMFAAPVNEVVAAGSRRSRRWPTPTPTWRSCSCELSARRPVRAPRGTRRGHAPMLTQQRARLAYGLILPALALLTALKLYPIAEGVIFSFQSQNMMRPNPAGFVGFAHYGRALFGEEEFWASLVRTVAWTVGSVAGAYGLGLGLALLLDRDIRGRALFRALLLVPWVVPDVVTALVWKWLYGDEVGILNFLLLKLGLVSTPVLWLSDPNTAMAAVILVQIWKLYPVMFITLVAALQNVPKELHEAALLDGADAWQRFGT